MMRLGAYQFEVTGNVEHNLQRMKSAAYQASGAQVRLLCFPECALTGYPPECADKSPALVQAGLDALASLAAQLRLWLLVGTAVHVNDTCYNAVVPLSPDGRTLIPYYKRALWGSDREIFSPGQSTGVYTVDGLRIGVRICYEIRFPEYFRELYRTKTDLNIVHFFDVSGMDDPARYALLKGHLQTRAAENVCPILSVNATKPFQTAPTALIDENGRVAKELTPGDEGLLIADFEPARLNYGSVGRKIISDALAL